MKTWFSSIVAIGLLIGLAACTETSVPIPSVSPVSPLNSPIAAPKPTTVSLTSLRLDVPLYEGANRVSGVGPAGVPIVIMDVSLMTVIGQGWVSDNGMFLIDVLPLVTPNMVGIMFDDTQPSPYAKEQIPCADRCRDQPMVGLVFDRAPVQRP